MVGHDMRSSACRHAQAPVSTDGEATLPFRQVGLEVALELIGGLVIDALPFQGATLPGAPQATSLCVPVNSLNSQLRLLLQAV